MTQFAWLDIPFQHIARPAETPAVACLVKLRACLRHVDDVDFFRWWSIVQRFRLNNNSFRELQLVGIVTCLVILSSRSRETTFPFTRSVPVSQSSCSNFRFQM